MSADQNPLADAPPEAQLSDGESSSAVLKEASLNPRQRAFIAEYLIDLNATQAYIRAGYSAATAQQGSAELLLKPVVRAAIERGKAQRLQRVNIKQDDVLHEMSALAMSRIDHYIVSDDGQVELADGAPDNAMAAVQSIKRKTKVFRDKEGNETHREYDVEIRLWDKPQPLKLTGRHVGLYPDRVEHVGRDGGPIELTQVSTEELLARHKALSEATE